MQFGTIASGSSGNCLYAGDGQHHLLIDAGISGKRVFAGLEKFGVLPEQIEGILVTHEHIDHIAGLGVLIRKLKIPVYATERTLDEILKVKSLGKMSTEYFVAVKPGEDFKIGDMEIHPYHISHDAKDPVAYTVASHGKKLGMCTDLGYYDDYTVDQLKDSDILYVEANHDIRMLQVGPYPYYLKQRILGNRGHLCNEMSGRLVGELLSDRLKKVFLGHLSKENNYPDLALETVKQETGLYENRQISLFESPVLNKFTTNDIEVAPRDVASELFSVI